MSKPGPVSAFLPRPTGDSPRLGKFHFFLSFLSVDRTPANTTEFNDSITYFMRADRRIQARFRISLVVVGEIFYPSPLPIDLLRLDFGEFMKALLPFIVITR